MTVKPTRERVFEFVSEFIEERDYSPTVREVAEGVGLASTNSAHLHLKQLVRDGRLVERRVTRDRKVIALP